jgi:multiple sugar transport system permease protein
VEGTPFPSCFGYHGVAGPGYHDTAVHTVQMAGLARDLSSINRTFLFRSAVLHFPHAAIFPDFPEEIFEAARIDGASEWKIFITIVLPLSKPVLATCALFQLMHSWNDFLGPLLYLNNPEDYTLAYGLQQFVSAYGGEWAQLMAASTMFTLPVVLLFFVMQKTFIQGIATTGGKN